jgi:hypothetical protein
MWKKPKSFARFLREESGVMLAETVIILPLLLWAFLGLYVYWDAYRSVTTVQKAAYTISDMITREMASIDDSYITGLDEVMEYLVDEDQDVATRVTSIAWSEDQQQFQVHWSRSDGTVLPPLTTATLQTFVSQIPNMAEGDFAMIVEVRVGFDSAFNAGLTSDYFSEFIVTRPRFLRCIVLNGQDCPLV